MKMFYDKIARRLVIVLFAACFLAICSAQANQTNSSSDGISVLVRVGQEIPEQPQSSPIYHTQELTSVTLPSNSQHYVDFSSLFYQESCV